MYYIETLSSFSVSLPGSILITIKVLELELHNSSVHYQLQEDRGTCTLFWMYLLPVRLTLTLPGTLMNAIYHKVRVEIYFAYVALD